MQNISYDRISRRVMMRVSLNPWMIEVYVGLQGRFLSRKVYGSDLITDEHQHQCSFVITAAKRWECDG